jgi:hypothetical protein
MLTLCASMRRAGSDRATFLSNLYPDVLEEAQEVMDGKPVPVFIDGEVKSVPVNLCVCGDLSLLESLFRVKNCKKFCLFCETCRGDRRLGYTKSTVEPGDSWE